MKKKQTTKMLAIGILLLLSLQTILALGVTPGRTTITYDNSDKQFFFTIINSEAEDVTLKFSTSGDLGEYIVLDEKEYVMSADEKYHLFRFTLDIGDEFDSLGIYEGKIIIEKVPEKKEGVGIALTLNSQVALKVTESSIELRKENLSNEKKQSLYDVRAVNALILIILLISLILIVLNKFIKRK